MKKALDKNEKVKVETVPAIAATKDPSPETKQPIQDRQRQKLNLFASIQHFFRIFFLLITAGLLVAAGYLSGTRVLPEIKTWLIDHNFIEAEKKDGVLPPQVILPDTDDKKGVSSIA